MNKIYEQEKNEIFKNANKRAKTIIGKYKNFEDGWLDGEPWSKELKEDSKRVLKELKQLDQKYHI